MFVVDVRISKFYHFTSEYHMCVCTSGIHILCVCTIRSHTMCAGTKFEINVRKFG